MADKFELSELLVGNKEEFRKQLLPEITEILHMEKWFSDNNLLGYFEEAIADFVVYRLTWVLIDQSGHSYEAIEEIVDKSLVADLFGEEFLSLNYWKGSET